MDYATEHSLDDFTNNISCSIEKTTNNLLYDVDSSLVIYSENHICVNPQAATLTDAEKSMLETTATGLHVY